MILKNTYLLTDSGWDVVQNLTPHQKICGISNNELSYATITKIEKTDYIGKVYILNKSTLHPDTKTLTKKQRLQKVSNIKNKKKLNTTCPTYTYTGYKINPTEHKNHLFDTYLIMHIIGYFMECGYLKNNEIIFKNSLLKLDHVSKILNKLNIKSKIYTNNKGTLLYSTNEYLYDFLLQFGQKRERYIPRKFLTLGRCYLECLFYSMLSSSACNDIISPKSITKISKNPFITNSPLLTDNLHELSVKLGYLFNTSVIYMNPMRRETYNPLMGSAVGVFDTFISDKRNRGKVVEDGVTTQCYTIYTKEKLRVILIRNNSKFLFISF